MATTTAKKKPAAPPQSRRNRDKETLYKPGSLSKWFAFFSVLLVLAWGWMIWNDYDRAWKDYQKAFFAKQLEIVEDQASAERRNVQGLGDQLVNAKELVSNSWAALNRNPKYAPALEEVHELEKDVLDADTHQKSVKGRLAPARFQFEKAKEKFNDYRNFNGRTFLGKEVTESMVVSAKADMEAKELVLNKYGDKLYAAEGEFKLLSSRLATAEANVDGLEADWTGAKTTLTELELPQSEADAKLKGLEALYKNNQWRNAVLADFISPTLKVRQNVLKDIHDNWNFATNVKVDRCVTCHLGIDMEEWGNPEKIHDYSIDEFMQAHSGIGLIAGKKSPHRVERFGCSVCHHGVGWATDFTRAAHTPMSAAEKARWKQDHDFGKVKHVDYPMLPLEHVQGQCWKCHKDGIFWPVGYEETLDHGILSMKDAVSGKEKLGQTRFDTRLLDPEEEEEPDARAGTAQDRLLGWHEVYDVFKMPAAPSPYVGTRSQATAAQRDALLRHYYGEFNDEGEFVYEVPEDEKVIADFAAANVHDYDWSADKYDLGYDSATMYGCQGCHTIKDFGQQVGYDDPPRMGPELTFSGDKLNPDFIDKWIKYPEMYRVDTKMPSFFWFTDKDSEWNYRLDADGKRRVLPVTDAHMIYPELADRLGSNTTPGDIDIMNLQVLALKYYLMNLRNPDTNEQWSRARPGSDNFNAHYTEELPTGNSERGRELVNKLGCIACHVVPEIPDVHGDWVPDGPARFGFDPLLMRGPRITAMGSKTNSGWLNAWLADPRHYTPSTRMPNMRITDVVDAASGEVLTTAEQQRSDIITYLLGFKDKAFDELPNVEFLPGYEQPLRDMWETYFGKTSDGDWKRRSSLDAEVSVRDPGALAGVLAAVGEKLMARNGCFGCHEVAGHEKDMPIGVELTREGIKDLHQLDFGAVPKKLIPHTRQDFFFNKLRTPRVWDWAKVKVWQDKLRMPRFNYRVDATPEEAKEQSESKWAEYNATVKDFLFARRMNKLTDDEYTAFKKAEKDALELRIKADLKLTDPKLADPKAPTADQLRQALASKFEVYWNSPANMPWPTKPTSPLSQRKSVVSIVLGLVDEPIKPGILHDPDDYERDIIEGRRVIDRYGCANCHTIEGVEGYLAGFATAAERGSFRLEKAAMPPNLFGQGLRTRTEWLVKFLKDPKYLRPLAQAHMPKFGLNDDEATALAKYFVRLAGRDQPLIIPRPDSVLTERTDGGEYVQQAEDLFNAMNCNKCHLPIGTPGVDPSEGGVAPPFSHSPERLRYVWVHALLHNPNHLIDGTKMPSFFPRSGYGRTTTFTDYQLWLKEDPVWQKLYASDSQEDKEEAIKQLAEAQMLGLTDYLLWHYRGPTGLKAGK